MEVWAFDEHRAGLKPVLRRVWAKRGRRPVAVAEPRYRWLDLYGFVRPTTGALVWFLCNTVNEAADGRELRKPCPPGWLEAYPVSTRVNRRRMTLPTISRAIRLRPTATPSASSSAWMRGAP